MKKCALINDLSGFGKCSLCVGIPIISVFGVEAHPLPTAVLSSQTGYNSYEKVDLTDKINDFFYEWKKLGVSFDGILTGYFSDERQVDAVLDFVREQSAFLLVDPVMGDSGVRYKGFSQSLCSKIKELALCADIVTPNVTELYLLTGEKDLKTGAEILLENGVKTVMVTGIQENGKIGNAIFERNFCETFFLPYSGISYSGTGDLFSAIVMGSVLSGSSAYDAVKTAAQFISLAVENTDSVDRNDGVDFEKFLHLLVGREGKF